MQYYFGIDFGGTKVKLGLFDQDVNLLEASSIPSGAEREPDLILQDVANACQDLAAKKGLKLSEIKAAGMGLPGPVNLKEGMILNPPNLPTLRYYPVRDKFSQMLGMPVTLENDANAAAWSEHVAGTAKDTPDYVFLTLGTGIGGGVICNSKLVHGSRDTGGELGHIVVYPGGRKCACGQYGCIEAYASVINSTKWANELLSEGKDSSLQAIFKEKGEVSSIDIFDHCENGDSFATYVVNSICEALGILCVTIQNFTNPSKIIFAGGMIGSGDTLLDRIKYYFRLHVWPGREDECELCFAAVGKHAGIIGAAALAIEAENN
ncbi:Glucokinase [Limihaloglobus sulfuriphilus]|uniref:Glucokinase n=1 Tax=Limihaloglobus sulfuriphilus TaxID=1851148 RepID=A0A1Q2MBG3_9BACT|nr:ROK family protein [Limihaloglobus sulfuriphilus]AQQ69999.1 Glucokinase [Limihaloglobus sulfuriphilus]